MKNIFKNYFFTILFFLIVSISSAQNWQWARHNGSIMFDAAGGIVVDVAGSVLYSGGFEGPYCYFTDDTSNLCQGDNDFFLIKYDANGDQIWWKQFGGDNNGNNCFDGGGVIIDNNNCFYITGTYCNSVNFGSNFFNDPTGGFFIAKLDSNGNCIWAKEGKSPLEDAGIRAALDNAGYVYVCGTNASTAIFDTDTIARGGFIAKYDTSGNLIWVKNKFRYLNLTTPTEAYPYDMKIYGSHILISGNALNDTITIDTITIVSPQLITSPFLASFDLNGNVEWLKLFGGNHAGSGYVFSIDNAGNSIVTGGFIGTGYFGNDTLTGNSQSDYFLAKFDINGNIIWARQASSNQISFGWATSTNSGDGSTYVTGYFSGNASFGNYNITANSSRDMFLARYDNNGNCLGVRNFGEAEGHGVAQDDNGNPYVCGTFINTVTIGNDTFSSYSAGMDDIFVAKCDAFTGIGEGERLSNQLTIFANPNAGKCNITIPDEFKNEKNLTLSIYDNTGKLIQQKYLQMAEGKIKLDLEAEAKGIYNVTLSNGKKSYGGKIVFE